MKVSIKENDVVRAANKPSRSRAARNSARYELNHPSTTATLMMLISKIPQVLASQARAQRSELYWAGHFLVWVELEQDETWLIYTPSCSWI